jgi:hypothetical protein
VPPDQRTFRGNDERAFSGDRDDLLRLAGLVPFFGNGRTRFLRALRREFVLEASRARRHQYTAGTLDVPTKLKIEEHIFFADKSEYYTIDDDAPQKQKW